MQDVQYLHGFYANTIENQIVAMDTPPNARRSMLFKERISLRHVAQFPAITALFLDECYGPKWVVLRDMVANGFKVCLSLIG